MIDKHADANATLCTDEATIYKGIEGYKQLIVNHSLNIGTIDFIHFGSNEHATTRAHANHRGFGFCASALCALSFLALVKNKWVKTH